MVYLSDFSYIAKDDDVINYGAWTGIPFFFGVASYCYEGVGMVLPLENSMVAKEHFTPILVGTVIIITTVYATFGICGYLAFGDSTHDVITLNLSGDGTLAIIVKVCLCSGLFFTYPLMLVPVFEVLQPLCIGRDVDSQVSSRTKDQQLDCAT